MIADRGLMGGVESMAVGKSEGEIRGWRKMAVVDLGLVKNVGGGGGGREIRRGEGGGGAAIWRRWQQRPEASAARGGAAAAVAAVGLPPCSSLSIHFK